MNPTALLEEVQMLIANSQTKVVNNVKTALAEVELNRREAAIIDGLNRLPKLTSAVKEIEPDVKAFDATGQPVGEPAYSEVRLDKLKTAQAAEKAMTNALTAALNDGKYDELFALVDPSPMTNTKNK